MDLNVKQIMKLVEDNSEDVTKSEVIVQVQELYRIYRNLAERYDYLTGELKYEEELRDSNLKLLIVEEEIVKLNTKLKKSESLELELKKQIIELEACFSNSNSEVMRLMEELSTCKENIKASEEEILMLNAQILRYENDLSNRGHEVEKLKGALCDARDNFSVQKASFQSKIFDLQCETKKWEIESLLVVQETNLQGQINQLMTKLNEKGIHIEALKKNLDKMKLKYDMLMTEKDCVTVIVNNLVAEEHMQLTKNVEDELKLKIKDFEKEVDKQRNMILDVSEEKREVISQLTFSLDHYRSGYKC
ncbi:hypothetical protein V6Z11_A13G007800 [Gossypium hirsutum]